MDANAKGPSEIAAEPAGSGAITAARFIRKFSDNFRRDPVGIAVGTRDAGMSAALWKHELEEVQELPAEPDPELFTIALPVMPYFCETSVDRKVVYSRELEPWTVQVIRPGERPRGVTRSSFAVLHLYMDKRVVERMATEISKNQVEVLDPKCSVVDPQISHVGKQVLHEIRTGGILSRLRIDALEQDLAIQLLRRWSNMSGTQRLKPILDCTQVNDWRIRRAVEFLEAHLAEDVGLNELAFEVGLSPSHVAAEFRRVVGEPPHRWVTKRRLERACGLLARTPQSIGEIAFSCGFASSQHFATVFQKHMGITPTAYRREC